MEQLYEYDTRQAEVSSDRDSNGILRGGGGDLPECEQAKCNDRLDRARRSRDSSLLMLDAQSLRGNAANVRYLMPDIKFTNIRFCSRVEKYLIPTLVPISRQLFCCDSCLFFVSCCLCVAIRESMLCLDLL